MSIERFGDMFIATCDICGDELSAEFEFDDAVQAKKDAGWKSRKIDGDWTDICDTCQARSRE